MKKKIIFVDNSTRCFYIFRLAIAKALIKREFQVYLLSPAPYDYYLDKILEEGIIHLPYNIGNKLSVIESLKLVVSFFKAYRKIKPFCIIHFTIKPNIYGTIAAKMAGILSYSVVPGTGSLFQNRGILSKLVVQLYKFAFKFPKKVWVLNQDDKTAFLNHKIIDESKLELLPSEGIDTIHFNTNEKYRRNSTFIFLYMGRMLRDKGVAYLAEASSILKQQGIHNFEVHLIGLIDGLTTDVIREDEINIWEQEGLVKYMGSVNDVRDYIRNSDCIILPTFYGEGVPRSLMEASAMKRVIIATDNVGCREVVDNMITGILCQPKDANDLAEKMETIMNMQEDLICEMGINGRKKMINEFDESIIIDKYLREILP